jgi:hypothetical protein
MIAAPQVAQSIVPYTGSEPATKFGLCLARAVALRNALHELSVGYLFDHSEPKRSTT